MSYLLERDAFADIFFSKISLVSFTGQIGKTESIVHFASENYENIVFINFVLEGQYKTILSDGYCHFFEGF